ncbi:MAG: hypothetical protein Q4E11_10250 [Corynebacterium sp.]|uniref:lipopolysaccharide biosynthesis protein n=1 Tax=Corynebacterium sp. TaxID=1720 RepID=UPI0026DC6858|nr:hypothetical protein [Corynebacterium sp.]MDO5030942.1 hypothetical protein [Corynebacterium sp.]
MSGFKWLSLATIVAAVGSFAVLIISARALPNAVNLQFVAYWGLFFALTGVLGGLMQETTRSIGAAREAATATASTDAADPDLLGARPIVVSLGVAVVIFIIMAITGPLWAPLVVRENAASAVLLMSIGLAFYSMQATVSGLLSGHRMWGPYAALIMIDILVRVGLALVAWYLHWGLTAWLIITVFGTVSWLILAAVSPATRSVLFSRADVPVRRFIPLMATAMGAAGASAILVTGFPTLVKIAGEAVTAGSGVADTLTPPHAGNFTAAVTIAGIAYAVTLTRAPLLMPLEKFQNAIIVHFVRHRSEGVLTALAKPLGGLVAFGTFGAALAWLIGPWIMTLILDESYFVPGPVLAALTLGATLTAVLMITGSVALAVEQHRMYLLGWLAATTIAAAILFVPGHLSTRTAAAIAVGSAVGVVIHLIALRQLPPRETEAAAPEVKNVRG